MSFYIKLSDEARLDLREANIYYLSISKSLNSKFNHELSQPLSE